MSDSQVTANVLQQPSQNGQAGGANDSTDLGASGGQPSNGQAAQEKNHVAEIQRIKDKEIRDLKLGFQQQQQYANQQIQEMRQRLAHMEESAAPDDFARLELRLRRAEEERNQYATAYQQTLQQRQEQEAQASALSKIAERYGVSADDLKAAKPETYEDAVDAAIELRDRKRQNKQTQDDDKRERNMPDTGGGAPRTASTQWENDYADARERKDSVAMMRLLNERGK